MLRLYLGTQYVIYFKTKTKMSEEELERYARWVLHECNEPVSELMWLLDSSPQDIQNEIRDNILKYLNEREDEKET